MLLIKHLCTTPLFVPVANEMVGGNNVVVPMRCNNDYKSVICEHVYMGTFCEIAH